MTFTDWLQNTLDRYRTEPVHRATRTSADQFAAGVRRRLPVAPPDPPQNGTNIYSREWDVLVVLDACRPDVLNVVGQCYPWLRTADMDTYPSVASYSREWLERTFTPAQAAAMAETALVSWNPYTDAVDGVSEDTLGALRQPYYQEWDDSMGLVRPDTITDHALDLYGDQDRLIAWYMQPHAPYRTLLDRIETFTAEQIGDEASARTTVWNLLRRGDLEPIEAHAAYADNLAWALTEAERLVAGVADDATVAVTADHGELFGEGGLWGHPKHNYDDAQVTVPWVPVNQARVGDAPTFGSQGAHAAEDVADQLEALGYR